MRAGHCRVLRCGRAAGAGGPGALSATAGGAEGDGRAGEGRAVRRIGCRHGASGAGWRQADKELPMTLLEAEADPSAALLRDCYDAPNETVQKKILTRLDKHARAFIGLSPLVMLATAGPDGADCSPRGDRKSTRLNSSH